MQVQVLSPAINSLPAILASLAAHFLLTSFSHAAEPLLDGFRPSAFMPGEQVREEWHDDGTRIIFNLPQPCDPTRSIRLVIYAAPNGSTIEQTLGCRKAASLDEKYEFQHVAAQIRRLRALLPDQQIALAVVEASGLSWPAYRRQFPDNSARIKAMVEGIRRRIPADHARLTLAAHSGGGSFIAAVLNAHPEIPDAIERIVHLDSNYTYSDDDRHGDKLLAWLQRANAHRLIVIAYDDREVTFQGKKIAETGGTWQSTQRMLDRFSQNLPLRSTLARDIETHTTPGGQALFYRHTNPENRILHTALVGEWNGLLHALALGTPAEAQCPFAPGRLPDQYIQPAPGVPPRPATARSGSDLAAELASLARMEREERIAAELLAGNLPDFLRQPVAIQAVRPDRQGGPHTIQLHVWPDYLSLGRDDDCLRIPLTPRTAMLVAERFGCTLPTPAMVDLIHQAAAIKLEPHPLGEPRETVEQFLHHHRIIERQLQGKARGGLVSGIKKDLVWSNRIAEKPRRVAIYGWHQLDGKPIQPLSIVHHEQYVDYSHGARLVLRTILLDGQPRDLREIVRDPQLAVLLSDEGVLKLPGYP